MQDAGKKAGVKKSQAGAFMKSKDPLLEKEITYVTRKQPLESFDPKITVPSFYSFLEGFRESVFDTVLGLKINSLKQLEKINGFTAY